MVSDEILRINNSLKSTFWRDGSLDPAVSQKLLEIATNFFEDLGLEGGSLEDVTFTGSLANYNWTKYSDVDLHLLVDFSKIDDNNELVRELRTPLNRCFFNKK